VFAHACKMGLEGIVSKRRESCYRLGDARPTESKARTRTRLWLKREAEENWGR
jgi:ATP-dependent DNA ligase